MSLLRIIRLVGAVVALCWPVHPASAERITVAVAANFAPTLDALVEVFQQTTDYQVVVASGSTGKHYAQILHGAPFDVFLAADSERPELLERNGRIVAGTRTTYALGRLALWSPNPELVDAKGAVLASGRFHRLAIANPRLAPYGEAARQVLQELGLYRSLESMLVRGENIGQTYQFVHTGAAELGFVAYSQVKRAGSAVEGSYWLIPAHAHEPLRQQAVLLTDTPAGRSLLAFLRSPAARHMIDDAGYDLPGATEP